MKRFTKKSIKESSLAYANYSRMRETENRLANYPYYGATMEVKSKEKPSRSFFDNILFAVNYMRP